jgi:hypothetical protein
MARFLRDDRHGVRRRYVGATFVVATLAANIEQRAVGMRGFITPTAVHLGSVLLGSAVLCVPTLTPLAPHDPSGCRRIGRARSTASSSERASGTWSSTWDDRAFYVVLPVLCYRRNVSGRRADGLAPPARPCSRRSPPRSSLLFVIGMRNAWDMANFMITRDKSG